ncbi:MAG TPA: hypothetical protein VGR26_04180 [Acidimicrobiales bacterium]|nr:hypothetical protein [Acidimicrobiales bacterium]
MARLGKIRAVRDSVADALATYTDLDVAPATTRVSRYARKASVPSDALAIATPVMAALVGEERLRQVARGIAASQTGADTEHSTAPYRGPE